MGMKSRRDAAVDVVVDLCGWLAAVLFVVGFVHGWWWGGDLRNIPGGIGESAATAAAERRGWPWVPLLAMICGGFYSRWAWCALADLARGINPRARHRRRPPRFPTGGGC